MATDGVYLVAMLWGMGLVHGVSLVYVYDGEDVF